MPRKGSIQTPEHKRAIREARWRWLFGANWQDKFEKLYGPKWRDMTSAQRRAIGYPPSENSVYATPLMSFLGKKEFCALLASRLRDPEATLEEFVALAELFARVRGWVQAGESMTGHAAYLAERKTSIQKGESRQPFEPPTEEQIDFEEQVRQAEARRKGK